MKRRLLLCFALMALTVAAPARAADPEPPKTLSIAVAANLIYALDALNAEFKRAEPDVTVTSTGGASGNLVVQIANGAPYDLFLSADLDFPQALIKQGQADPKSLTTFAIGRLVLWTTTTGVDVSDVAATVRSPRVVKLAIANVATAPYGRAAKQALEKLGVWAEAQPKLVVGENITQTTQFVETGNADAGFVALSVVVSPKLKDKGRWVEVPDELYSPLAQGAVITTRGIKNPVAPRYLEFLRSPAARKILENFGYRLPQ